MEVHIEKMMEQLNSGESKTIFKNMSCIVIIGLTTSGRAAWQEEEETRKDTSIALLRQEQSCTSELFKVIQDAVLLILLYRTMLLFRTVSSSTIITSDVQSIYTPSSIWDCYLEVKIWATDRQYSFCLCIPWTKTMRILLRSTWVYRVMTFYAQSMEETSEHGFLGRHQSCSEERIEVLSDSIERNHSSRNTSSLLYSESCSDVNWRSHLREGICVTSSSSKDLLETWLDERSEFRICSTTRWTSYSTIQKFPIKTTKSKPRSW